MGFSAHGCRQPDHHPATTRPPSTRSAASQTPLSDDDRDILAGISVMVLAIANRQNLADQPHMRDLEDEEGFIPCGEPSEEGDARCMKEVGHAGRQSFEPVESFGPVN